MRRALAVLAVPALSLAPLSAHADTIQPFHISGEDSFGQGLSIDGTIDIDTTRGTVTGYSVLAGGVLDQGINQIVGETNDTFVFFSSQSLIQILAPSLVNFTGGDFTSNGPQTSYMGAISSVPEPSSLALLGTGLLGAIGVLRRRLA